MRVIASVAAALVIVSLTASAARAQQIPLAELLPELILREIIVQSPVSGLSHVAHFSPIEANEPSNPAVAIVQAFNGQLATQFATFPLGSSTGGFTYVFDESLGTFRRGSSSFGPLFAERALTIGRRKLSAGFNYQRTSYDTFEGRNLDDGSIKFYLRHEDCCTILNPGPNFIFRVQPDGTRLVPPFEGDLIEADLSLKATTHTAALFANYGVTDRWDIGLAVPFVRVDLDAGVRARILRLVTATNPDVHTFEIGNPRAERVVQRSGHATGVGDIVLRTKYRVLPAAGGGLAASIDFRLPTGDENELLGAGGVQAKFLLVASRENGRFGQHVNVGYTVAGGRVAGTRIGDISSSLPDEINYSGGVAFVPSPRVTMMADVVGRTLRGAGRLDLVRKPFEYAAFHPEVPVPGPAECRGIQPFICTSIDLEEFDPRSGNLTLVLGTAGVKFNPVGNLLISGNVLFPLSKAGLRSKVTTVIGVDYAF
jgi:hypothetical protein